MQTDPSLSKLIPNLNYLLVDGFRIVFERKCPFEINLIDPEVLQRVGHEVSSQEEIIVKILVKVFKTFLN
jgi:hypothetical protein